MFSGLNKMDVAKMERELEKNLSSKDFTEWKQIKDESRKSYRKDGEKTSEKVAGVDIADGRRVKPAIRTTSPPNGGNQ